MDWNNGRVGQSHARSNNPLAVVLRANVICSHWGERVGDYEDDQPAAK